MNPLKPLTTVVRVIYQIIKYHSTYDIEKALRNRKADGIRIGESRHLEVQSRCCERHALRLQEVAPNLFTCVLCEPTPPLPEQHTDPLQQAASLPARYVTMQLHAPGDFAKLVNRQQGRTIHTQITEAISKVSQLHEKEGQN